MGELSLFRYGPTDASELPSHPSPLERPLQRLIEAHLERFLGVRLLQTEYSTGKLHAGRIDTLGIDEDGSPVIVEYKRATDDNVVFQGLYYLDWLADHHADFELLVRDRLGRDVATSIDWKNPRLICVAEDFTKFDAHAVQQIDRNISLFRYKQFDPDLILFELVNATTSSKSRPSGTALSTATAKSGQGPDKPMTDVLAQAKPEVQEWFAELREYGLNLGDDVQEKSLKLYLAFRRVRNFCCIVAQSQRLFLYLRLDPSTIDPEPGFTRDVRGIGHWGTGDLEVTVDSTDDVARAKSLIRLSYEAA
jgi:predicted transport protein